ncbi:MAG: hypothetical protein HY083_09075 [Gammaproteobacteria bacterium]|nr:hypothetical protein [Gammaproteobacteria bacterium]
MTENKIVRICWNTEGWRKPSGRAGKSKNKKTYEYRSGYGHEEWLLDITKLIDGWHYACLQPIGAHHEKYVGKTFNLSLYSIDDKTKSRWWIGGINDVTVITPNESRKAYIAYKKNGWLHEMEEQLHNVGADVRAFRKTETEPEKFFLIRFRPISLDLLDTPQEFSRNDPAVSSNYYVLLDKKQTPKLITGNGSFVFTSGHNEKKSQTKKSIYEKHSVPVDLIHNRIQAEIHRFLVRKYGKDNVGTEQHAAGYGSQSIDVVVKEDSGDYTFYEIKTSYSVRLCVREALGQLLEYAYYYPSNNNVQKLVIVSPNAVTTEIKDYLIKLRNKFNVPVYYQRFDPEKKSLEDILY